jgi:outer membrane lipoprotein-sorting protein
MKKIFPVFLATIFILASICFAQEIPKTIACEQIVTAPNMPKMQMKLYMKESNVRLETKTPDGKEMIMIKKGDKMITVYPDKKIAMQMPMSKEAMEKMGAKTPDYTGSEEKLKEYLDKISQYKVGEETIDGRLCDVYEIKNDDGKNSKVWLAKDIHWPLKTIATDSKGDTIVEFKNIKLNEPVDDSLFEVPAGMNFVNMDAMMQGAQQMMNSPEFKDNMKKMMEQYKKD